MLKTQIVEIVIDEIMAKWTTERGVFNDRDEVYFVAGGVIGSKTEWRHIEIPAYRISPDGDEDYFQFWNETTIKDIFLLDFTLNPEETAFISILLREQDNAELDGITKLAIGAAAGLAAYFTGLAPLIAIAKEKLTEGANSFYNSFQDDGDQTIGGFAVRITNSEGGPVVEWIAMPATALQRTDGHSAGFEATDSDAAYTLRPRAKISQTWTSFNLAPVGSAPTFDAIARMDNDRFFNHTSFPDTPYRRDSTYGSIAAVSRIPNSMELWWIGPDGSVQGATWYEGETWKRYELAPAGSASIYGSIAAVSRIPSSMEVWWITPDGTVQGKYWYESMGNRWSDPYYLAPAGQASIYGSITAVSRIPGHLEVWWIVPDGSVQGTYWYEGMEKWSERYLLAPAGQASVMGDITAVSMFDDHLNVWWIVPDGSVQGTHWYKGMEKWSERYLLAPAGQASITGGITAVSRMKGHVEVWWIVPDGSVQGIYWYESMGNKYSDRYLLVGAGSATLTRGITAIKRKDRQDHMEVWWIEGRGSVQGRYWYEGMGKWGEYKLASAGTVSNFGNIAVVSRMPNSMELWGIGADGSVRDFFWYE